MEEEAHKCRSDTLDWPVRDAVCYIHQEGICCHKQMGIDCGSPHRRQCIREAMPILHIMNRRLLCMNRRYYRRGSLWFHALC